MTDSSIPLTNSQFEVTDIARHVSVRRIAAEVILSSLVSLPLQFKHSPRSLQAVGFGV